MKILIIKLGALGDVIRTTSILAGLKSKYANCEIYWVAKKDASDFLKNNGMIDKIFLISEIRKILSNKYDLVISLDDDYNACKLASNASGKKIIGAYMNDGKRAYSDDSSLWFDMGLLSRLGKEKADGIKARNRKTYQEIMYMILGLDYKKQEPILMLNEKEQDFGKNFAGKNGISDTDIVIGINTGAGGRWEDKKLSVEKTAELIDSLNREVKNAKLVLFGGPQETERNNRIKNLSKTKIIDAGCGNSLMEFASLVNLCRVIVTSDSLALHIGVALKKNVVAFFCPTPSAEIELYGRGIKIVPKVGCLCCYKQKCDITPVYEVMEIVKAVKKLLNKGYLTSL